MAWCAVSGIGTWIALALIRTGKRREPEADEIQNTADQMLSGVATPAKR
jgi:hypothetical protein